ncbi:MAG: ABC transporter permease [Planctomycetaceae bacterium]
MVSPASQVPSDEMPHRTSNAAPEEAAVPSASDVPFFLVMGGLSSGFILLILLLLAADLMFTSVDSFLGALQKPEIRAAFRLTLITCTVAAILSVWVGTPLGYVLSRYRFPGRWLVDTIVDIPIVLPPLVLGLSLLILFHLKIGNWQLENWLRDELQFPVTYRWPAVILAQFAVSCAFAVRTMRVTFDQISPRLEDVARTLGCSRGQAFLQIALPQAWRGSSPPPRSHGPGLWANSDQSWSSPEQLE